MDYLSLGKSGLKVSRLCLGTMMFGKTPGREWALNEEDACALTKYALEAGINFFDTADAYGAGLSEQILGRSIHKLVNRDETVIATKLWAPTMKGPNGRGLSRKHILESIDASLRRLGTDYVDLYQIHRWDNETPIEETLDALNDVVRSGKARYLGASSMSAWQFMKSLGLQRHNNWAQFISMQNHYNLIYREEEREMIPLCLSERVGVIPWSPLARGFLAKKDKEDRSERLDSDDLLHSFYGHEQDYAIRKRLNKVAANVGLAPAAVATAWLSNKPGVSSMIIGSRSIDQLEGMRQAIQVQLSKEQVEELESLYLPREVVGMNPPQSRIYPSGQ